MIITILSPIVLCAASIWLGYILGQRKERLARKYQVSELVSESVERDMIVEEMKKIVDQLKNEAQ